MSAEIEAAFRAAGVTGWLHAVDIDSGRELGVRADAPVVLASVFKVPLLVAFFRRVAAGTLDPSARVRLREEDRRPGSTGTSMLLDDVEMSLRDLAAMMITVSDNTAADALLARVGLDDVNATLAELGLARTRVLGTVRELYDSLLADSGATDLDELWPALTDPAVLARLSALDPSRASHGTPRDLTLLLRRIWRDEAAPPAACAAMRRVLSLQVWPHRLASGFPYDDVQVSGKTGTLPTLRNEIGVIEYPDGPRYAVAVFTRAHTPTATLPRADAVIGTTARLALRHLHP
ncbi:serine hydrolase [Actinocorallia lasiicapitis]